MGEREQVAVSGHQRVDASAVRERDEVVIAGVRRGARRCGGSLTTAARRVTASTNARASSRLT